MSYKKAISMFLFFFVCLLSASAQNTQTPNDKMAIRNEVFVKGGTFQMGSTSGERDENPVHGVTVSDFWMMKTEVTQKDYTALMGVNPSKFRGDDLPVEQVSWYDAVNYANALSKKDGLEPAYRVNGTNVSWIRGSDGWRLPTEAEWEYAARGGQSSRGYTYSGGNEEENVSWSGTKSGSETHPVETKAPNELGLYDMSGNVWEWCWDWYGAYSSSTQTDPMGPSSETLRVLRGGCWGGADSAARSVNRYGSSPDSRSGNRGFRLVRSTVR